MVCGMKGKLLLFAFGVAAAAPAVDVVFKDAVSGVVEMSGDGTGDVINKHSEPVKVKTGCVYGFEYSGREIGSGLMLGGNKDVNVDRRGPDAGWYEYRQAYQTEGEPGATQSDRFHYGHYHGKGTFSFKDGKVFELKPAYAEIGGVTLGHGESIDGNSYRFDTSFQSFARNHARPLRHYRKASFNSNHWNVGAGAEIVYQHEVAGRSFVSGAVTVGSTHFTGRGPMLIEVSLDGREWQQFGSLTNKALSTFSVPEKLLPTKRLFVRLRGGRKASLHVSHYGFEGKIDGSALNAFGSSRYFNSETGALYDEVKAPVFAQPIGSANAKSLVASPSVALWGVVEDVKVFRGTPLPAAVGKALSVALAGNESESVQLVVTPKEAVRDVRVGATDLVLKRLGLFERARIPASAVKVERLGYVNVRLPTDETGARGEWPDPILPQDDAAFPVKAGVNQPFWITVKTPKGLPKGIYRGAVDVAVDYEAGGRTERLSVPFEVEVYGFDLPDRMSCETAFGFSTGGVADYHAVKPGSPEHDAVLEKYVKLMSDHRISIYHWGKGEGWGLKWRNEKDPARAEPVFDWDEFDDAHTEMAGRFHFNAFRIPVGGLGHGFQGGFELGRICGVSQTNALYHTLMAKYLGAIESHLREKGWLDASYVYWFDEPQQSVFGQVNAGMLTLKRHCPGLRRMLTASPSKTLWDGVNLWNPRLDIIYSPAYADVRARGDQFWWYICCGPRAPYPTEFIDHAGCELRTWLWMTWARNVTGVLIWQTNYWTRKLKYPDPSSPQNPYEDAMAWSGSGGTWGNGDGRFVYPPLKAAATPRAKDRKPILDEPNASYRLAILRDGIEDYEYFAMLKRISPADPLLKVPESVFRNERDFSPDPSFMRAHRVKLARAIERLGGNTLRLPKPATCIAARPDAKDGFRILETASGAVVANRFDDTIQETLWRVENGELDAANARTAVLVLGTNNRGCTPEDMAAGMKLTVDAIRRRRPDMKILVYASFPCRQTWRNLRNRAANTLYAQLADGKTVFFRDVNGRLPLTLFPDGLHPNDAATAIWLEDVATWLREQGALAKQQFNQGTRR